MENASEQLLPIVVVGGISGAGMSTALQVFEDLQFVTADGLPPSVLPDMARLLGAQALGHSHGVALGVRLLRAELCEELLAALRRISTDGGRPLLLFLTADPAVILRRYATTRRPHPLEREDLGLEQAMAEEAADLAPVREAADIVIDTSAFSVHDLRRMIQRKWRAAGAQARAIKVNLISFGFKYGVPREADLVFDLRFLPNPFFVEALRPLSGKDQAVVEYIFAEGPAREFSRALLDCLSFLLPYYDSEGRYRLSVAVGCTGGRHRSVAVVEALAVALKKQDYAVSVEHRHMELG
jgi:UPF0042 nucleotide-binding protein